MNILSLIERMKIHKDKQEQAQQDSGLSAGQNEANRRQTNQIERQIKQTQKEIDQKRNALNQQHAQGSRKPASSNQTGNKGAKEINFDGELNDANLNILEFLAQKPKRPEDLKF